MHIEQIVYGERARELESDCLRQPFDCIPSESNQSLRNSHGHAWKRNDQQKMGERQKQQQHQQQHEGTSIRWKQSSPCVRLI